MRKATKWSPSDIAVTPRRKAAAEPPLSAAVAKRGRARGAGRTADDIHVDMYVGQRIKLRRTIKGMSQSQLGTELRLTFQQVQKYERGTNRVGASKLWQLAQVLNVPVSFFFDGLEGAPTADEADATNIASRRMMQLANDFAQLTEEERSAISKLVGALVRRATTSSE